MIELDGRSYVVNTPTENAFALLEYVNQFMIDNDVKNRKGEVVQFKISLASPIWLLIIGIGYLATVCQKIMFAVAQAFNIADCSNQQVLSLAKIARMKRKEGSYTTITGTVTAAGTGPCAITTSLTAKATYEGEEYTFHPVYNETIAAGTSTDIVLMCTVTGPVYIEAGAITAFEEEVTNFGSMSTNASQPGSGIESISSLRTRMMTNEAISPLAGAIQGINALDGVTKAVVLYNPNYDSDMVLGGKTVPPKKAIVFVQGYSDNIAKEYYTHMAAQTYQGSAQDGYGHAQSYSLENGQDFTMYYFAPVAKNLYLKVKVNKLLTTERGDEIKAALSGLSNSRQIGENYTTAYLIDSIDANMLFTEITDIKVSIDGTTWLDTTDFNEGDIGLIANARIEFDEPVSE